MGLQRMTVQNMSLLCFRGLSMINFVLGSVGQDIKRDEVKEVQGTFNDARVVGGGGIYLSSTNWLKGDIGFAGQDMSSQ